MLALAACGADETAPQEGAENDNNQQQEKPVLVFADAGWDSLRLHNSIAQYILENGYGYQTDVMPGSTPATLTGLEGGDIDIYMEVWTGNVEEQYQKMLDSGNVLELSVNFDDNTQGFYVPTYVIEGDPERGIEPMAPDLKSVEDLPKYWELFKDPEDPSKGRIYGAIPGWQVDETMFQKVQTYNLDETFNYFRPGSGAALATSIATAYEEGEPWVGYYWEPTWIMGKYDMTLLEEAEYSDELWNNGYACEFPPNEVTIAVHKDVKDAAPDVVEFLSQYQTSSQLVSDALGYMQDNEATVEQAAQWFLKEHEDLWTSWVPADVAEKVKSSMQ
ncbi:MAG: ABC transporter substrate-binding protein [Bacillaceae bacterium]|nr:ABC transporter substrate-binding protein [Bacillaceae bacterium]